MKTPRLTIGTIMAGVAIVAADFGLAKMFSRKNEELPWEVMPMLLLAQGVVLWTVRARRPRRRFGVGFAAGGVACAATLVCAHFAPSTLLYNVWGAYAQAFLLFLSLLAGPPTLNSGIIAVAMFLPQFAAGVVGGLLARQLRRDAVDGPAASGG